MQVMTWGKLIIIIAVACVAWYGFVVIKYYGKELLNKKRRAIQPVKWTRESVPGKNDDISGTFVGDTMHAQVHELMQEIRLIFAAALRDHLDKEQMVDALGKRLPKYSTLPAAIQQSVNQHIINEFSLQLKINVSVEELNQLWK